MDTCMQFDIIHPRRKQYFCFVSLFTHIHLVFKISWQQPPPPPNPTQLNSNQHEQRDKEIPLEGISSID